MLSKNCRVDETFKGEELFAEPSSHSLVVIAGFDEIERFTRQRNRPPDFFRQLGGPLEGCRMPGKGGQDEQDRRMVMDRTHNVLLGNVSTPLQTPRGPGLVGP